MNEELQSALAELINKVNNGVDSSSDFLMSELPDVIQQLLLWHGLYSGLVSLICALVLFFVVRWDIQVGKSLYEEKEEAFYLEYCLLGSIARGFVYIPLIIHINLVWLQIMVVPKVWLLEYASKLTTG